MRKKATVGAALIVILWLVYFFVPGLMTTDAVAINSVDASEDGTELTISAGVFVSMGYVRACKVEQVGDQAYLRFYMAFGGINGKVGAKSTFTVTVPDGCTELYQIVSGETRLVLAQDEQGQWYLVRAAGN